MTGSGDRSGLRATAGRLRRSALAVGHEVRLLRTDRPELRVCFHHLPKCGGTSLDAAIRRHVRYAFHLDAGASHDAAETIGAPLHDHREHLLLYALAQPRMQYVHGHFAWSSTAHEAHGDRWRFVTVLRDPVDRWLSHFHYHRARAGSRYSIDLAGDAGVEHFAETPRGRSQGMLQARLIAGGPGGIDEPERLVALAVENLERFDVLGVLEEPADLERRLHRVLGVPVGLPHRNRSAAGSAALSASLRSRIEDLCAPDLEVYARAREILRRRS